MAVRIGSSWPKERKRFSRCGIKITRLQRPRHIWSTVRPDNPMWHCLCTPGSPPPTPNTNTDSRFGFCARSHVSSTDTHSPESVCRRQGGLLHNGVTFHTEIKRDDKKNMRPYFPSSSNSWYSSVNLVQIVNAILTEVPSGWRRKRCSYWRHARSSTPPGLTLEPQAERRIHAQLKRIGAPM